MPTALITGASRGLGLALAHELADRGWDLVLDARDGAALEAATSDLGARVRTTVVPGDVTDAEHRQRLAAAVPDPGGLDLLVNNASTLGASPLPALEDLATDTLEAILATNTIAPLALIQAVLPALRRAGGTIVNVSSDAAVEPYETWGGYGASKAALDHLTAILAEEVPELVVHAVDPGDMRTAMHQEAFPGVDISDRPHPDTVAPVIADLVERRSPSGRYRVSELSADRTAAHAGGVA